MTYPEDRVLVGVLNRKRDFDILQKERWYRIPEARMSRGIQAEYIALFLSRAFGDKNGKVHYYARVTGLELSYRRFLLPKEADHPRADEAYYRISLGELFEKSPPITNPTKRTITFIYTTWDRFTQAQTISDLYSKADFYVDRIYHALRSAGMRPQRFWDAEGRHIPYAPGVSVMAVDGPLYISMRQREDAIYLSWNLTQEAVMSAVRDELQRRGGLAQVGLPAEND
jgi:hypothetical protein